MPSDTERARKLDIALLQAEFPPDERGSIYLNTGSCGRKPRRVLESLQAGQIEMNSNPTLYIHLEADAAIEQTRKEAARLFAVEPESLLLTNSTTQGLQLIMQSFLTWPGDEIVTTEHEHGITRTICQYLEEKRGVVVHTVACDPLEGSNELRDRVLARVNARTRLVLVSEIDCYTGWRPDLLSLEAELKRAGIPLLVDGAHSPGQGECHPGRYRLWVGSGHKWLGGPNGTGFARIAPELVESLEPVWIGDGFYQHGNDDLRRFESQATADNTRWPALTAALRLTMELNPAALAARQLELTQYFRQCVANWPHHTVRTPDIAGETSGMVTVTFSDAHVTVPDLRQSLWDLHKIWIQPDFFYGAPGHGMRVSCHPATTEHELDLLSAAVAKIVT